MRNLSVDQLRESFVNKAIQFCSKGNPIGLRMFVLGKNKKFNPSDESTTENIIAHFPLPVDKIEIDKEQLHSIVIPALIGKVRESCEIEGIGVIGTAEMVTMKKGKEESANMLDFIDSFKKKEVFLCVYSTKEKDEKKVYVKKKSETPHIDKEGDLVYGFDYILEKESDTTTPWQGDFSQLYSKYIESKF